MEGEVYNFTMTWLSVLTSLCYCYTTARLIPKGTTRLIAVLPVICLFFLIPLNLSSVSLGGPTAFFITWLANFKLFLFAYGKGPLSSYSNTSLPKFILLASLPIKIQQKSPSQKSEKPLNLENKEFPSPIITKNCQKSPLNYATKTLLLAMCICVYDYKDYVHPKVILCLYCFHIYASLEIMLAMIAAMARVTFQLELDPQFDEPYLSTSLQDFWGKRWNLMVTGVLRPTVYYPVRSVISRRIGRKWAPLVGVLASFLVSGLMHELIFFYLGRVKPTWEVTCFFLLHGVCLAVEIAVKKALLNSKWRLPPAVSTPLTVGFVVVTGFWLFFPPLLRCKADDRSREEVIALLDAMKNVTEILRLKLSNVIT